MRYYIDTEFSFDDAKGRIFPISIGIVAEDGREFYGISRRFPSFTCSEWVDDNVLHNSVLMAERPTYIEPPLPAIMGEMRDEILAFVGNDTPEFWGDYAAFDYVVLSFTMGGFDMWPDGWPMYINDMQQAPGMAEYEVDSATPHNALADARAIRDWMHAAYPPEEVPDEQAEQA